MSRGNLKNLRGLYPEIGAGGFSRIDGTVEFYTRINALLHPDMQVLDFGAGRGIHLDREDAPYRTRLNRIQGKVRRLIGVDVDAAVLENRFLDQALVFEPGKSVPLPDQSFDLIYSDWVIEHVPTPELFAADVHRLLKPGGWFCARTPNRWGMTGIATTLIPNRLHAPIVKKLQGTRGEDDVFPTTYKMNTRRRIRRYFPRSSWDDYSYSFSSEPPYVQWSKTLLRLTSLALKFAPNFFSTNIHIFLQKKP